MNAIEAKDQVLERPFQYPALATCIETEVAERLHQELGLNPALPSRARYNLSPLALECLDVIREGPQGTTAVRLKLGRSENGVFNALSSLCRYGRVRREKLGNRIVWHPVEEAAE